MIEVTVCSVTQIADALGSRKLYMELPEESDVLGLLHRLADQYGEVFRELLFSNGEFKNGHTIILLNGRNIFAYDGLYRRLCEGDEILLMPAVSGG